MTRPQRATRPERRRLSRRRNRNSKPRRLTVRIERGRELPMLRCSIMRKQEAFTILSTHAPLVEVGGDGPIWELPDGLTVPDGAATTAAVDLRHAPIRRFRVDAPPSEHTSVVVTDSPYGAFVGVRRCITPDPRPDAKRLVTVARWPKLGALLKRRAPSLLALWYLFTDDVQPPVWRDVTDPHSHQVRARGGDLIVVHFVNPHEVRHA